MDYEPKQTMVSKGYKKALENLLNRFGFQY